MARYHQPQRSPPLRLRRHLHQLPFPLMPMSSWQPPPFRPSRWVRWGDTLHQIEDIAIACGIDRFELSEYLNEGAPPEGGRLRKRPCRWATNEELLDHELEQVTNPPQPSGVSCRWKYPDGTTERIPLEQAAARILVNGRTANPLDLHVALRSEGPQHYRGHRVELVKTSHTKQSTHIPMTNDFDPTPEAMDNDQQQEDAAIATAPAAIEAATTSEEGQQEQRSRRRAVWVDDTLHPSITAAAAALGITNQALAARLKRTPAFEHSNHQVRLADDGDAAPDAPETASKAPQPHQQGKTTRKPQTPLSEAARALLAQTAEAAGVSVDDAVLALLPPSAAMARVVDAVGRESLAELSPLDWKRLQAVARMAG